ncbi:MAG: hypothetical protein OXC42_00020 [Gammaproteobacteria bacterium]|nr:hypothetical protein [Gammaproteobacteria bacterium]
MIPKDLEPPAKFTDSAFQHAAMVVMLLLWEVFLVEASDQIIHQSGDYCE